MLKTLVFQNLHQIGDTKRAQEYGGLKKNKESKAFCKKLTLRPLALRGQAQYTQACDLGGIAQRFLDRPEGTFPWKLRQLLEDGTTGPDPAVVQVWQELIGKFRHALMVKYNELPSLFFGWVGEEKERASPACKPLSFGEAAGVDGLVLSSSARVTRHENTKPKTSFVEPQGTTTPNHFSSKPFARHTNTNQPRRMAVFQSLSICYF